MLTSAFTALIRVVDDENEKDKGLQGFLRLSITVLHSNDKQTLHKDGLEDEESGGSLSLQSLQSLVMLPPTVKQTLNFLVVKVHSAENLPNMDGGPFKRNGGDFYCAIKFANNRIFKTNTVQQRLKKIPDGFLGFTAGFNQELWLPLMTPTTANRITLSMWDKDFGPMDDLIASHYCKYGDVCDGMLAKPRWVNFYGAQLDCEGSLPNISMNPVKYMNTFPNHATCYRGRMLVSFENVSDQEVIKREREIAHTKKLTDISLGSAVAARTKKYMLRAFVISGSELPPVETYSSIFKKEMKLAVEITCGPHSIVTKPGNIKKGKGSDLGSVTDFAHTNILEKIFEMPEDIDQVPHIFIYLVKTDAKYENMTRICYAKFTAREIFDVGFGERNTIRWVHLIEDKGHNALSSGQYPGSILLQLGFGLLDDKECNPNQKQQELNNSCAGDNWMKTCVLSGNVAPCKLLVHVYQGRGLPAADDNGLLDPYVEGHMCGKRAKTQTKYKTRDPMWYETLEFDIEKPMGKMCPDVILQVWDWDRMGSNDWVGNIRLSLDDAPTIDMTNHTGNELTRPKPCWKPICRNNAGDSEGEILVSCQVILKESETTVLSAFEAEDDMNLYMYDFESVAHRKLLKPKKIGPVFEDKFLQIVTLGLRGLKPYNFMPIHKPFIEFDVGADRRIGTSKTTKASKMPSGQDPNFCETLILPIRMPKDPTYAPRLNIAVHDTRLGGFSKPLVGVASVPLDGYIKENLEKNNVKFVWEKQALAEEEELETFPGNKALKKQYKQKSAPQALELEEEDELLETIEQKNALPAALGGTDYMYASSTRAFSTEPVNEEKVDGTEVEIEMEMKIDIGPETPEVNDIGDGLSGKEQGGNSAKDSGLLISREKEYRRDRTCTIDGKDEYLQHELERIFDSPPFDNKTLYRGQKIGRQLFGVSLEPNYRKVGSFKGYIKIVDSENPPKDDFMKLLKPKPYQVRLYVLKGRGLTAMDGPMNQNVAERLAQANKMSSDPYLRVSIGNQCVSDRKNYIPNTLDPDFYRMFEFNVNLPGTSQLKIECMDHDDMSRDDEIGQTIIDLEDRLFEDKWRSLGRKFQTPTRLAPKPLEWRSLYCSRAGGHEQGKLEMWLDILTPSEVEKYPPIDISRPPPQKFEVRMVIWKTKNVVSADELTDQNDLFVRSWMDSDEKSRQDTDIHWRCKKGKGSFNWRMKFPVELPCKNGQMHIQMWDQDIVKYNDLIAETTIDLSKALKKAYEMQDMVTLFEGSSGSKKKLKVKDTKHANDDGEEETDSLLAKNEEKETSEEAMSEVAQMIREATGIGCKEPENADWLQMTRYDHNTQTREDMGQILCSLEILPEALAQARNAGLGRSEPNNFPVLPPPTGRLKFDRFWNPFYLFRELLGPKLCHKCCGFFVCVGLIIFCIFGAPFINSAISLFAMMATEIQAIIVVCLCLLCCACTSGTLMEVYADAPVVKAIRSKVCNCNKKE